MLSALLCLAVLLSALLCLEGRGRSLGNVLTPDLLYHKMTCPNYESLTVCYRRNSPDSSQLVTLDFPQPLQQRVINALKADPKTVDLRAQAPHFYALGARIMELFDDRAVLDTLVNVSAWHNFCFTRWEQTPGSRGCLVA